LNYASFAFFRTSLSGIKLASLNDAWNHPDPKNRELWRIAINRELGEMENKKIWEIIHNEDVPEGRRKRKCKWILKIKSNSVFQTKLVACGYSPIPGIDISKRFAPVINDVSFRVMLYADFKLELFAFR
jgi:hypothetical protein